MPEPRTNSSTAADEQPDTGSRKPPRLPYEDGVFLALHLIRKMSSAEFEKMLRLLNEHHAQVAASDGANVES
ncbi:hypothetical protein ACFRFU_47395 [Streptomyces sp. NPDC056704]|uniref:hypothetical protein n=1 Tax=Streptomyces sp. NPDC056704 TaxID=3345917 RepID=UPI0036CEDE25